MGVIGAAAMTGYAWRCTRDHDGFENAFGANWSDRIPPEQAKVMVQKRWRWFPKKDASPEPIWERDVPFWTVPGTDRELLCDIWRPANGSVSGLAYVYMHGSGWAAFDKDLGTRPYFRHLVAQGHTVMDVGYRLIPEVDLYDMIGDVKHAIAWLKANAPRYGVDPDKIVLGGGSAGCHLALLAGYAPHHPELTPEDLAGVDLSACGILSFYGPTNLVDGHDRWVKPEMAPVPIGTEIEPKERFRLAGRMDILMGGHPQDIPDKYQLASPTTHVHPGSPPTLLIQGDQDLLVPVEDTRAHYAKLAKCGVPAINVVYPWTDHAFDLILPRVNPTAQSAWYDVDRFLALLAQKG
jgi:acetyl esterase/lipase